MANINLPVIDVKKYGALGNGSTDDSSAFNNAISYLNSVSGGILMVPAGNYVLNSQIVMKNNVQIKGVGPSSHLNFSSAGAIQDCLYGSGSVAATSVNFNATITKGDTVINYPSAPTNVTTGSILLIYNSTDSAFNSARTYYRKGEWVKVKSVSGGVVTLDKPVFDTYTSGGSTTTYLLNQIKTSVSNLKVTFKNGLVGIRVQYGSNCNFEDLELTGTDSSCLYFDRCYDSQANKISAFDSSAPASANYGIVIGNSQRMLVSNCILDTTRHGLAMGGGDFVGSVPNRDVLISDSIINGHSDSLAGADIHGNAEHITYRGNRLLAGIAFGGDYITISDNDIRTCNGVNSFAAYASELLGPNITITRNRFVCDNQITGSNSAIINFSRNTSSWQYANRSGTLKVSENEIDMVTFDGSAIFIRNGQTDDMLATSGTIDLEISNNKIHGTTNTTGKIAIEIIGQLTGTVNKGFKTVRITGNHLVNSSLNVSAVGSRTLIISNNDILSASVDGIKVVGAANYHTTYQTEEEMIIVENNRIIRSNKTGILIQGSSTGVRSYTIIRGNVAISCIQGGSTGSSATDGSLYVVTFDKAFVERNVFGRLPNDSAGSQIRFMGLNTITNLYERDNSNVGTVETNFINAITNRYSGYVYDGVNKTAYVSAPPSTGAWSVGDFAWNYSPTSGAPFGFLNISAGFPGTFVSLFACQSLTSLPTASSSLRGSIVTIQGGTGVRDISYVCKKLANDTYDWVEI